MSGCWLLPLFHGACCAHHAAVHSMPCGSAVCVLLIDLHWELLADGQTAWLVREPHVPCGHKSYMLLPHAKLQTQSFWGSRAVLLCNHPSHMRPPITVSLRCHTCTIVRCNLVHAPMLVAPMQALARIRLYVVIPTGTASQTCPLTVAWSLSSWSRTKM